MWQRTCLCRRLVGCQRYFKQRVFKYHLFGKKKPFKMQRGFFCHDLVETHHLSIFEKKHNLETEPVPFYQNLRFSPAFFSFKQVPRLRHLPLQAEVPLVARGGPRLRGNIQDGGGGGAQESLDKVLSIRTVREGGAGHYKKINFI